MHSYVNFRTRVTELESQQSSSLYLVGLPSLAPHRLCHRWRRARFHMMRESCLAVGDLPLLPLLRRFRRGRRRRRSARRVQRGRRRSFVARQARRGRRRSSARRARRGRSLELLAPLGAGSWGRIEGRFAQLRLASGEGAGQHLLEMHLACKVLLRLQDRH